MYEYGGWACGLTHFRNFSSHWGPIYISKITYKVGDLQLSNDDQASLSSELHKTYSVILKCFKTSEPTMESFLMGQSSHVLICIDFSGWRILLSFENHWAQLPQETNTPAGSDSNQPEANKFWALQGLTKLFRHWEIITWIVFQVFVTWIPFHQFPSFGSLDANFITIKAS